MSYMKNYLEEYGTYGDELYNLYKNREINFYHFKFIHKSSNRRGFTQFIKLYPELKLKDLVYKFNDTFNRNKNDKIYSIVKWKPPVKYLNIVYPFKKITKNKTTFGIIYATLVYVTEHRGFQNYI